MARCEICDYCDTTGPSDYNNFSALRAGGGIDRGTWERILSGDGMPNEGRAKIWEQKVTVDKMGELCSTCRKEIQLTSFDNYLLFGDPELDKFGELVHTEVQTGKKERAAE